MSPSPFDRSGYPTLGDLVYLNQASLGLVGDPAATAMHRLLDDVARHGNAHMSDEDELGFFGGLRERASRLYELEPAGVTVTASASELLGQAPFLLSPPESSTVVLVSTDFPAVTRPWLRLAEGGGCRIEFVDDRSDADLTDLVISRIDSTVSVVAIGWVQYATGTVIDVPRLRTATREAGASLVLDVTQGAGALRCPLGEWGPEIAVSSGYKWLGGHGGVAIGAVSPEIAERVPPLPGWMGAADAFDFDATGARFAPDARRFTQSTMSYVSLAGLTASIDDILGVGLGPITAHARELGDTLIHRAAGRGWRPFRETGDPAASPHIIALGHPSRSADQVVARLREQGVVCSSRLDRVRVSIAAYNDDADVDALLSSLP